MKQVIKGTLYDDIMQMFCTVNPITGYFHTLTDISKAYNVSFDTLKRAHDRGKWTELRKKMYGKLGEGHLEKMDERKAQVVAWTVGIYELQMSMVAMTAANLHKTLTKATAGERLDPDESMQVKYAASTLKTLAEASKLLDEIIRKGYSLPDGYQKIDLNVRHRVEDSVPMEDLIKADAYVKRVQAQLVPPIPQELIALPSIITNNDTPTASQ